MLFVRLLTLDWTLFNMSNSSARVHVVGYAPSRSVIEQLQSAGCLLSFDTDPQVNGTECQPQGELTSEHPVSLVGVDVSYVLLFSVRVVNLVLSDIEGLFVFGHRTIDDPYLSQFPRLKVISNHGVGFDHIDVAAATRRGVKVACSFSAEPVRSELTLAVILNAARCPSSFG